jgi:predicted nucleic acid-binding protein
MKAGAAKRFALDASVAVAWCFEDEKTKFTEAALDLLSEGGEAIVPSLWPLEVANAALIAVRHKRITQSRVTPILQSTAALPILIYAHRRETGFRTGLVVGTRA